ncbi:MAG TPA: FAD-dependent oxidoreductase [Candidatus Angelobacter sp.]|nr:FAD-dependent oxidoreductase [Candidatus Angelobacter sp.]
MSSTHRHACPPPDGRVRNPWLREALADEGDPSPLPGPATDVDASVVIIGGGYTGLWTAFRLTEHDPSLRVVILEQDICGGGPSGRNGGFVNAWWDEIGTLVELFGDDGALSCATAAAESVHDIGAWCEAHGVDAHYRRGGMLTVSTTPSHDGRWRDEVEAAQRLGRPDAYAELSAADIAARCRSPRFRGGALMPDGATVHPAHLVRGLRRVCLERGVTIHEGTRVSGIEDRRGPVVRVRASSAAGEVEVRAGHVVMAMNAWTAGWSPFRTALLAWGSYMVRTEPAPDVIASELGWTGGESIVDARFSVHYLHVTRDGRIAIGAGGGKPGLGGRIGRSFTDDAPSAGRAADGLRWFFPALDGVAITDAWGGPIDISPDHLPHFGTLPGGRVHYAYGYSGNGVAPSHLGGRILAGLVLGADDRWTRLPIVNRRSRRFPPEPFRWVGARILREAMIRREDAEEAGRRPGFAVRQLSQVPRRLGYRLGPGG